ncbi:chromosome partitioning protein ParA, partial [Sphingomonas sp. HMWF008]
MNTPISLESALTAVAGTRATGRIEGDRASIVVDVSGLDAAARDALEAEVRAVVSAVPGVASVRIALTSQRTSRVILA